MKRRMNVSRASCPCNQKATARPDRQSKVVVGPEELTGLFGNEPGDELLFVTSPRVRTAFDLAEAGQIRTAEFSWAGPDARATLVEVLRDRQRRGQTCSVLSITEEEFEHFRPEELQGIKLAAISYFSGAFSADSLRTQLDIVCRTDYQHELKVEEQFLALLDRARRIRFHSPRYGAVAVFEHRQAEHWFSMHGPLGFGQQIVLPTGELAVLADASGDYSASVLPLDGEIILQGHPVVHRGGHEVSTEEVEHAFAALVAMRDFPVLANVRGGVIEDVASPVTGPNPFLEVFRRLLDQDGRYRKVHEIGFGTNVHCRPLRAGNFFPNERFPGVHFGLGLGGYTLFHHDLVCTEVDVLIEVENGETVDVYKALGLAIPDDPCVKNGGEKR